MDSPLSLPPGSTQVLLGFFRHGPAEKRNPKKYPNDDLRPLTSKGRKSVKRAARGLESIGFIPSLILASPARRAQETAELIRKSFGLPAASSKVMRALYHQSPPRQAMQRLALMKFAGPVLLVGHEPWLGDCLSLLLTGRRHRAFPFRKSGFAIVTLERVGAGQGTLVAFAG